jgi:hypothetical protein
VAGVSACSMRVWSSSDGRQQVDDEVRACVGVPASVSDKAVCRRWMQWLSRSEGSRWVVEGREVRVLAMFPGLQPTQ